MRIGCNYNVVTRSLRTIPLLLILTIVLIFNQNAKAGNLDSLKTCFHKSKNVDDRADLAIKITSESISKPKVGFQFLFAALKDSHKLKDKTKLGQVYRTMGVLHFYQAANDSALIYYKKAIEVFKKQKATKEIVLTLRNCGLVHSNEGNYDKAIRSYTNALSLYESEKDTLGVIGAYNDIGNAFLLSGNQKSGLKYQRKALALLAQFPAPAIKGNVYNSIGYIYQDLDQLDSAIYYYEASLKLKEKYGNVFSQMNTKNNLCTCLNDNGESRKSIICFEQLIILQREAGDNEGIFRSHLNIAHAHADLNNFMKADDELKKIKDQIDASGSRKIRMEFYRKLHWVKSSLGKYKEAYEAQNIYRLYKDSIFSEEKNNQILEVTTKYEVEKKNRELLEKEELLTKNRNESKKKALRAQLSLKKRDFWIVALGGLLALILLSSRLLIQRQRNRAELEKSQAVISERDRGTLALIDAQEEERIRIAKELHDGIGNQLLGIYLKWNGSVNQIKEDSELKEELKSGVNLLKESMDEVRNVSHQMMPKVLSEFGLIPAIEEMMDRSLTPASIKFNFEARDIENKLTKKLELTVYRIMQELVTNVIKHSGSTEVQAQLFSNQGYLILILEDNGNGLGSDKKSGNGIGLSSIQSRLHTINGEFTMTPGPYTGTLVTIRIPLKA